jgi:hypothetical protein
MNDIEKKARDILSALEKRPPLFFEVIRIIRDEYEVAGPWVEIVPDQMWQRNNEQGKPIACCLLRTDGNFDWQGSHVSGQAATSQEGMAEADSVLRELGFLLS